MNKLVLLIRFKPILAKTSAVVKCNQVLQVLPGTASSLSSSSSSLVCWIPRNQIQAGSIWAPYQVFVGNGFQAAFLEGDLRWSGKWGGTIQYLACQVHCLGPKQWKACSLLLAATRDPSVERRHQHNKSAGSKQECCQTAKRLSSSRLENGPSILNQEPRISMSRDGSA